MAASVFSFTQAKLLFMAIRSPLFPEAPVSQTGSYCFTAGLWFRAQTLSPTITPPTMPLFSVGSQSYYFYLKTYIQGYREKHEKETERGRKAHRETEKSGRGKLWFFWSYDRCYQSVYALQVASKEEGAIDLLPYFNQKSGFSSPEFPLYLCTNYQTLTE